jgi:hypothetical protein
VSSPLKKQSPLKKAEGLSPDKLKIKNQFAIPSFLEGFDYLTEDDLDILATYEEEQSRRAQTRFERIFPTKETIDTLGPCFEC